MPFDQISPTSVGTSVTAMEKNNKQDKLRYAISTYRTQNKSVSKLFSKL